MKKAWILFALVLVISIQLTALSLFHEEQYSGQLVNDSSVTIAKWNYVDAHVTIEIAPVGLGSVQLIFPNGTVLNISSQYIESFNFPKTGDFFGSSSFYKYATSSGNASTTTPLISLTPDQPLNISIGPGISNISMISIYNSELSASNGDADFLTFFVYGNALVWVNAYGVVL